jgi:aconitate hydratase
VAPRYLGLRLVLAESYARIHWQNLANFGILALELADPDDVGSIQQGDVLVVDDVRASLQRGHELTVRNRTQERDLAVRHRLSPRQVEMLLAGGMVPWLAEHADA